MPRSSSCVLCGNDIATEVRMNLVEWRDPTPDRWSAVPRCTDRAACRSRVETVLREVWPVADGTPGTVLPPAPAEVDVEPPAAEEVIPWLRG